MNFKELLLPLCLALLTTWAIQYYFTGNSTTTIDTTKHAGQMFVAPETPQEAKPLNKEINFIDEKKHGSAILTQIDTKLGTYVFSTDGACLQRFDAHRFRDDNYENNNRDEKVTLTTIFPLSEAEKDGRCFLVALNEKTPYYYQLVGKNEDNDAITLVYKYVGEVQITKKYVISKHSYKLLLEISVQSKQSTNVRVFFPAPVLPELASSDVTYALIGGDKQAALQKIEVSKLSLNQGWFAPSLFGGEDKYFVNALVDDVNQFVQRAYYHVAEKKLFAILESPSIQETQTWQLGFYVGPKEEGYMTAVDPRLEQTLDYSGWLAPIAKAALALLKWLYHYLHNYGLAIIALTILMKLVLLPFTWHAERGNKQRQEFQKKLNYLQQKYKHDKELLAQERAELIRKNGMPGLAGCLPLLLQIPVFFALNRVLSSALELYQAPFILWIHDLSARDPYYVLPLFIVLTMLLQAFSVDSQQRFAVMAMALVFGAIATNLAAGLCLYIFVSTLLGIIQTAVQRQFRLGV